jgi:hypothetical protein
MRNWKLWAKAAAVRAIKTVAQTAVATIGTTAMMSEVDWMMVASTAALAGILSILTIGEKAHTTEGYNPVRAEFMAKYEEAMGSFLCKELKPKYRTEADGCLKTCELTGEVLAAYVAEKGLVK